MKWIRRLDDLIQDGLLCNNINYITASIKNMDDKRNAVLLEILCKLPHADYQIMRNNKVWFFAPHFDVHGWNGIIPQEYNQMIYLSPHLEEYMRKDCLLIVAHEIAHSLLGHTNQNSTIEKENEAWNKVVQFGFDNEEIVNALRNRLSNNVIFSRKLIPFNCDHPYFKRVIKEGYTFKAFVLDGSIEVEAFFDGKKVGNTNASGIHYMAAGHWNVNKEHQCKGVGPSMFLVIEEVSGKEMRPSGRPGELCFSDEARKRWESVNRPFAKTWDGIYPD